MICATFSEQMVSLLRSFIGCSFDSYEYVPIGNGTYGNLQMRINNVSYELQNQQNPVLMNGESADLAGLSIVKSNVAFTPVCGDQITSVSIEEGIQDIVIVRDSIQLPDGEDILMDMAVVFKTAHKNIMFSRDAWFSEFITISNSSDLDEVYPICRAKDTWRNDDEAEVLIYRTEKSLKNE